MSFQTKNLVRDSASLPIPQYFNIGNDSYEPVNGKNGATFVQIKGKAAKEPFSGNTDTTYTFSTAMHEFVIINDGNSELTVGLNGFLFTVKAGELFDEQFEPFSEVTVKTTSPFRAYARG
ncbi:hypothetical protein EDM56_04345 [Brevibacillus fluminis]|uniref:Uncharacterized protein n=1 Tax=Brevibacillus fluminis TaxID=511487 RepID=A0A3M8DWT9_9BACL|nr:hypothetical protein [Brevibacillus fluminis]RNB91989.1 hypothetical protein EDM56_04345 [Brevibacillus fluminis]